MDQERRGKGMGYQEVQIPSKKKSDTAVTSRYAYSSTVVPSSSSKSFCNKLSINGKSGLDSVNDD